MRISDWSSDGCSSDLARTRTAAHRPRRHDLRPLPLLPQPQADHAETARLHRLCPRSSPRRHHETRLTHRDSTGHENKSLPRQQKNRSEEHTSEIPSLLRTSYAVFCLKKQTYTI